MCWWGYTFKQGVYSTLIWPVQRVPSGRSHAVSGMQELEVRSFGQTCKYVLESALWLGLEGVVGVRYG
jgi:hypothetical protein